MDIEERRKALFQELRQLMQKVHNINIELGYLDRGEMPPERFEKDFIPAFIRKNGGANGHAKG